MNAWLKKWAGAICSQLAASPAGMLWRSHTTKPANRGLETAARFLDAQVTWTRPGADVTRDMQSASVNSEPLIWMPVRAGQCWTIRVLGKMFCAGCADVQGNAGVQRRRHAMPKNGALCRSYPHSSVDGRHLPCELQPTISSLVSRMRALCLLCSASQ